MKVNSEVTYETARGTELMRFDGKKLKIIVSTLPLKEIPEFVEALQNIQQQLAETGQVEAPVPLRQTVVAPVAPPAPVAPAPPAPPQYFDATGRPVNPWGEAPRPSRTEDVL